MDVSKMSKEQLQELVEKQDALLKKEGKSVKIVQGEFKDAETGKVYGFKDNFVKTLNSKNQPVASEKLLKDEDEMRRLIDMGYYGLKVLRELKPEDKATPPKK